MNASEILLIILLVVCAVYCCVVCWVKLIQPVSRYLSHEHLIADFRREMSQWEHGQK